MRKQGNRRKRGHPARLACSLLLCLSLLIAGFQGLSVNADDLDDTGGSEYSDNQGEEESTEPVLQEQTLTAEIYTDSSYTEAVEDWENIYVSGNLPEGATVKACTLDTESYAEAVEGQGFIYAADISICLEDGSTWEPDGESLTVSIELPEMGLSETEESVSVYYLPEGGTPENMAATVSGDTVTFETTHFSPYGISVTNSGDDDPETVNDEPGNPKDFNGITYYDLTQIEEVDYDSPDISVSVNGKTSGTVEADYYSEVSFTIKFGIYPYQYSEIGSTNTYFYYKLPDGIWSNSQSGQLNDDEGTGEYEFVTDGEDCYLLIRYNEVKIQGRNSSVNFTGKFYRTGSFDIADSPITLNIVVDPIKKGYEIEQKGNSTTPYILGWTIDVGITDTFRNCDSLTVTDVLSESLTLTSTDDVKVYGVDSTGAEYPLAGSEYSVSYDRESDNTMIVVLNRSGDSWGYGVYRISYSTTVAIGSGTVEFKNEASVKGKDTSSSSTYVEDSVSYSSGTDTSDKSALWISKIDGNTGESLEGAEFQLSYLNNTYTRNLATLIENGMQTQEEVEEYLDNLDESLWTEVEGDFSSDESGNIKIESTANLLYASTIYRIEEVEAPNGYVLSSDIEYFIIPRTTQSSHWSNSVALYVTNLTTLQGDNKPDFTFVNYPIEGSFTITKYSALDRETLLSGAVFTLYSDEDCTQVVDTQTVEANGKATFSGLEVGTNGSTYYLKETEAPDGYAVVEEVIKVMFDSAGTVTFSTKDGGSFDSEEIVDQGNGQLQVFDQPLVDFSFTKVDATDTSTALSGAEFMLYRLDCTDTTGEHNHKGDLINSGASNSGCWTYIGTQTSGSDGTVAFTSLLQGTYRLVETKAPDGYILPTGQWEVILSANANPKITAVGSSQPPAFGTGTDGLYLPNMKTMTSLPSSGATGTAGYLLWGLALMGGGSVIGIVTRMRRSKFCNRN